jgi:hypothetical protein
MNDMPLRPNRDPFATLVSLTAAALSRPGTPRTNAPAAPDKSVVRGGSLWDRLDRWLWRERQRELERALTSAVDIAEIEARLRDRERKLLQRYY